MKFWGRTFKDNRMLRDAVVENTDDDTRTHKVFDSLDRICYVFDIPRPIWLDSNISDFKKYSKAHTAIHEKQTQLEENENDIIYLESLVQNIEKIMLQLVVLFT